MLEQCPHALHAFNRICHARPQIAVEVDDALVSGTPSTNARQYAMARMRQRLLQAHGWHCVEVSLAEWAALGDRHQQQHFFIDKVNEVLAAVAQQHQHSHAGGCCGGGGGSGGHAHSHGDDHNHSHSHGPQAAGKGSDHGPAAHVHQPGGGCCGGGDHKH